MKQGAAPLKRKSKRQKIHSSEVVTTTAHHLFEEALADPVIVKKILHYCPHYRFYGKNNMMIVSKQWHKVISESDLYENSSFQKLLQDCLISPEVVIDILRDETLLPYLSRRKLLELISCYKEFAIYILQMEIFSDLSLYEKALLTQYHHDVAMYVLKNPKYFDEKNMDLAITLGCQHPQVAQLILDKKIPLSTTQLLSLAKSNSTIARQILNDKKCDTQNMRDIAFLHLDVLIDICNEKKIFPIQVDFKTPEEFVLNLEHICRYNLVDDFDLLTLGKFHSEVAMQIVKCSVLREKLFFNGFTLYGDFVDMCILHRNVAEYVCDTPEWLSKLNIQELYRIGIVHPKVAMVILKTETLCDQLSSSTMANLGCHQEIAMTILKTEKLYNRLTSHDLRKLGYSNNPLVVEHLLMTSAFCNKITQIDLIGICSKKPSVLKKVISLLALDKKNEVHLKRLQAIQHIAKLAPSDIAVAISQQSQAWNVETNQTEEVVVAKVVLRP
ncbi:hypothetical protein [Candidatus Berkiella aquae]|uniref:Uncharacterized protein n=1 Tax=Candidatus Berkiella aquae TaxID=295108 RepID=A0A0Q9YJB2_9GAMM|nr:hypothetical protein [Candidatus Berkiella aquae]MCS5710680.1 hypothetical protein [Candidatus Berkiella aquae]